MSNTKEKTKHIDELHSEHQQWIKEIGFYKDELIVFNRRLDEIAGKYSSKEVLSKLEHFQNQFILQNEVADILLHDLNVHENALADKAKEAVIAIDHRAFPDHPEMRVRMSMFHPIFRELKNDYMGFLSKLM